MTRSVRFCNCAMPDRQQTVDGVLYCGLCEELLRDPHGELLPVIAASQAKLIRIVDQLVRDLALLKVGVVTPTQQTNGLIGTTETARILGRSRDWVRRHATTLGVVDLTGGPKPRRMFVRARIEEMASGSAIPKPSSPPRKARSRPRRKTDEAELLPIKGRR